MTRFRVSGWGERPPVLFEVEPEYGLTGYAGILNAELAALDAGIGPQGKGATAAAPSRPADLLEMTVEAPRHAERTPDWRSRDLSLERKPFRIPLAQYLVDRLRDLHWAALAGVALAWPARAAARAAVERDLGPVPHRACFMPLTVDPLPLVLQRYFPKIRWERIAVKPSPDETLTDVVRVPLARPRFNNLEEWARFLTHSLPEGSLLALRAVDLPAFLRAAAGRLPPGQRLLVTGRAAAVARWSGGWRVRRALARGLWLLEGPPPAIRRPEPAPPPVRPPRISVVTISFNQAPYLEATLRSVLDQGYPNLEYIVIDGGSTDGSVDILERYRSRLHTLVIEPDKGQSDALCKGFARATGDILTWLCSDDLLDRGALFRVAGAFSTHDVDLVAGGCRLIDAGGRQIGVHHNGLPVGAPVPLSFGDLAGFCGVWQKSMYFYQPEVFFSRGIWEKAGGFIDRRLHWAMDYDMFLRFALAGARVLHIPYFLAKSRVHDAQKTRHDTMEYLPTIRTILGDFQALVAAAHALAAPRRADGDSK